MRIFLKWLRHSMLLAILWLTPEIVRADLIVEILDATITAGGTGSADVMIRSDTGLDNLAAYVIDLNITPAERTSTTLEFVDPSNPANVVAQANQAALLLNANYIFGANGGTATATNVGAVGPATTYSVIDFAAAPAGVTVPKTPSLLAHLDLTTMTGSPPHAGDFFKISIDPVSPSFFDSAFNPIPFTVHSGTVDITPGSAEVPEPSSLVLLATGLGAGWYRTRRAKKWNTELTRVKLRPS